MAEMLHNVAAILLTMDTFRTDFQMVHVIVRDLRHYLGLYFFGPTETQESSMDSKSDLDCARQFHQKKAVILGELRSLG